MRYFPCTFAFVVMLFGIPAIKAASVDIGKHRALRIDIPDGWKLSSMVSPESGCLVVIQPSPEINAEIKLSVAFFSEVDPERETAGTGWLVMDRTGKVNTWDGV